MSMHQWTRSLKAVGLALIALAGWLYVFAASEARVIAYGLGSLLLGAVVFVVWDPIAAQSRLD